MLSMLSFILSDVTVVSVFLKKKKVFVSLLGIILLKFVLTSRSRP